jgi:hypothetical protein
MAIQAWTAPIKQGERAVGENKGREPSTQHDAVVPAKDAVDTYRAAFDKTAARPPLV